MPKYEKKGTITFSPTAITDKEEVHEIHEKSNGTDSSVGILYIGWAEDPEMGYRFTHLPDGVYKTLYDSLHSHKPVCVYVMSHCTWGGKLMTYQTQVKFTDEGEYIQMWLNDNQSIGALFYPDGTTTIQYMD